MVCEGSVVSEKPLSFMVIVKEVNDQSGLQSASVEELRYTISTGRVFKNGTKVHNLTAFVGCNCSIIV